MASILVSPALDLAASRDWWQRLGFTVLSEEAARVTLTDGAVTVWLDSAKSARPAVVLARDEPWDDAVTKLAELTTVVETEHGHLAADPTGTWIHLHRGAVPAVPDATPASALSTYMGVSLEVVGIDRAVAFYERLGFSHAQGSVDQGWVLLVEPGDTGVSLMGPFSCPHSFVNPSLTYFNSGNNPAVIAELRDRGVAFYEEVTAFNDQGEVDNVILRDPGGLGIFVFND